MKVLTLVGAGGALVLAFDDMRDAKSLKFEYPVLLLLATVVGLSLLGVWLEVQFNTWNREFYNALEQKNYADFKDLILYFSLLAVLFIAGAIYKLYLTQMLVMRWRVWLTNRENA